MKATLLIKNIKNIYTCNEEFDILSNAFIAIHHEYIIDIGTGSFTQWMDSSTRVIDAQGECVVPAFIDSCFQSWIQKQSGDQLRIENEIAFALRCNGILTMATPLSRLQRKDLFQDIVKKRNTSTLPIISTIQEYTKTKPKKFLLSCGVGNEQYGMYTLHPLAFYLYNVEQVNMPTLLKSMTLWPSQVYELNDRGQIAVGKRADLLVIHTKTMEEYLKTMGVPMIRRMIKNGIPIFPDMIRC